MPDAQLVYEEQALPPEAPPPGAWGRGGQALLRIVPRPWGRALPVQSLQLRDGAPPPQPSGACLSRWRTPSTKGAGARPGLGTDRALPQGGRSQGKGTLLPCRNAWEGHGPQPPRPETDGHFGAACPPTPHTTPAGLPAATAVPAESGDQSTASRRLGPSLPAAAAHVKHRPGHMTLHTTCHLLHRYGPSHVPLPIKDTQYAKI